MSEPRQLGVVRSYDDLIEVLRARALEIGATREAIDDVAGVQKGYTATALALGGAQGLGRTSMGPILGAHGIMLIAVEDLDAIRKYANRVKIGKRAYQLNGVQNRPVILRFSRRYMKKIARKSAPARMKKIPAWKRRQIARKAGRASAAKRAAAPKEGST